MTQSEHTEGLDEILETMACKDCSGYPIQEHEQAKAKLEAYTLRAVIDELRYARDKLTNDTPTFLNIHDRITELQAKLNKLEGK